MTGAIYVEWCGTDTPFGKLRAGPSVAVAFDLAVALLFLALNPLLRSLNRGQDLKLHHCQIPSQLLHLSKSHTMNAKLSCRLNIHLAIIHKQRLASPNPQPAQRMFIDGPLRLDQMNFRRKCYEIE